MKRPAVINDLPLFDEILNNTSEESKLYVTRSLAIANQILVLLEKKGMKQKDLAALLNKKEAEVSRWLNGFHNFTIKSITKIEAALGEQIIFTKQESEDEIQKAVNPYKFKASLNDLNSIVGVKKRIEFVQTGKAHVQTPLVRVFRLPKNENLVDPTYTGKAG